MSTEAQLQPDYRASWTFLQRMHPGRLIVVSGISIDKKNLPTETFGPDEEARFIEWVAACGSMPANLYYSLAEPLARATKKLERQDLRAVWYLHVDVDPRTGEDVAAEQVRILALLRDPPSGVPKPTAIVYSGGGYQALWKLSEPLAVDGSLELAEDHKLFNLHIERLLGGDHCHNVDRILRLPGTINVPDAKKIKRGRVPALAELVEWHADRVYPIGQFVKAPTPQASTETTASGNAAKAKTPANVRQFAHVDELKVSDACRQCIVNGFVPSDAAKFPSRSEMLFWVVCELTRAQIDEETIYAVVMNPEWKVSESILEKGNGADRYALRQIERAREQVAIAGADFEEHDGKKLPSQHNARVFLDREGVRIRYDEFADRFLVEGLMDFGPQLDDKTTTRLRLLARSKYKLFVGKEEWSDFLTDLALYNRFHPVRDYLDSLTWDQTPRIDHWLVRYGGVEDSEYTRAVGSLVLIAAVRRVLDPGCKFDEMLVLEGLQGKNKSTALATLAVREEWFSDDLPLDADTKRFIEAIAGKWIVEAGELKGMRKGEVDTLKSALSRRTDRARLAYGRHPVELHRQCVIIGSTNSDAYLKDSTGNRRFWPVRCRDFDVEGLRRDRDQLWAEARVREARGESIRLDPKLYPDAGREQEARRLADPFEEALETHLGGRLGKLRAHDVWTLVGKADVGRRTQDDMNRLGEVMRRLGWERIKRRFGSGPEWCYARGSTTEREESLFVFTNDSGEVTSVGTVPDYGAEGGAA